MNREVFNKLLNKYLQGEATDEERWIVDRWYEMLDDDQITDPGPVGLSESDEKIWTGILKKINDGKSTSTIAPMGIAPSQVNQEETGHTITAPVPQLRRTLSFRKTMAIAASFVGILFVGVYLLGSKYQQADFMAYSSEHKVILNDTQEVMPFELEDGSKVYLRPNAQLIYPEKFAVDKREVMVSGEAFFEVSTDTLRPFYVFSDLLVTKVVGTSFIVKSDEEGLPNEVSVISGKVVVKKNDPHQKKYEEILSGKKNEVTLTPNHKAVYQRKTKELIATIVDEPVSVLPATEEENLESQFIFEEVPFKEVMKVLENIYGIEIKVSEKGIYTCSFTGDLSDQDLYTMLELICQTVGAKYEILSTVILVEGGNCK